MTILTPGILYLIATPIGHIEDISYRAIKTLNSVDYILAEDTRHSQHLLEHYHIKTPLQSLHEHNESHKTKKVIEQLQSGQSIALISDAGTPLISDPGYLLVNAAHQAQCRVTPIPGACAAITALSASGLPTHTFSFEGFLPARSLARKKQLAALKEDSRTLIFFEAPHRLLDSLTDIENQLGGHRMAVLARELTKVFETIFRAPLSDLLAWVKVHSEQQKGECVLIVAGASDKEKEDVIKDKALATLSVLMKKLPKREAIDLTAQLSGYSKNKLYPLAHASEHASE